MTKFSLISDCHLNFGDLTLTGGDVLVMAGDIMEAGHIRRADNAKKDTFLADRYRRFIAEELAKYQKVVYVMGNHEHYHNTYEDTIPRLRAEMPEHVTILEAESMQIDDVHIFGGTFWTDCNRRDPVTMQVLENYMHDFTCIKTKNTLHVKTAYGGSYWSNRFDPAYTAKIHKETLRKLDTFCADHASDKVLVVSHHAPTELSLDPAYTGMYHENGGYHSRLSDFILDRPCIKAWVHGHVHNQNDYMMGDCRIMCNPRGYNGHEHIADTFTSDFVFEL